MYNNRRGYNRSNYSRYNRQSSGYGGGYGRRRGLRVNPRFFVLIGVIAAAVVVLILFLNWDAIVPQQQPEAETVISNLQTPPPQETPQPTEQPSEQPAGLLPMAVDSTQPSAFGIEAQLNVDGQNVDSYTRSEPISFGDATAYTQAEGIVTFRGNNWRNTATYGNAIVSEKKLTKVWTKVTGNLPKDYGTGFWSGSGWTGQGMAVRWPAEMLAQMNLNDDKKNKENLVEIIYPTLDGEVYFLDLEDGKKTRDNISIGLPFKGAGALDPRGYPLLYLGAGDATPARDGKERKVQEFFIYDLFKNQQLYSLGKYPDAFAPRDWHAYDSSVLVDAATDTLIVPAENGILYTLKLNTQVDAATGSVTVNPTDVVKMRYTTQRSRNGMTSEVINDSGAKVQQLEDSYWLGMEASAVTWGQWLYISDNAGDMLCIDLNTMQIVWVQDILDDSNSTPILEVVDGHPYLYISTSLHWTADGEKKGIIPVWKLDAITGEVVWRKDFNCNTVDGLSGGVEGTGLLGTNDISDLVIYPIARTPDVENGLLVALNKQTGEVVWQYEMGTYAWSSPVAVYDSQSQTTYLIICDTKGNMFLLDGKTGEKLNELNIGSNVEASPFVYNDMIVVGTRDENIIGVKIS